MTAGPAGLIRSLALALLSFIRPTEFETRTTVGNDQDYTWVEVKRWRRIRGRVVLIRSRTEAIPWPPPHPFRSLDPKLEP